MTRRESVTYDSCGPIQGVGIGLRTSHYPYVLEHRPAVPWFEVLTDNYLTVGGPHLAYLFDIRKHYPMVMHGVGMSLGSTDPLNKTYLQKVKTLADQLKPTYISDHLCWISVGNTYAHELLPLPYTQAAAMHVAERIQEVQEFLGQRILIENVSSYLTYCESDMTEWEFINLVAQKADCYILLDINNIYVSAYNHNFSSTTYLNAIDKARVKQFHIAGYQDEQTLLLDTHGAKVADAVWQLYAQAVARFDNVPTLLEWDNNIPEFQVLLAEQKKAERIIANESVA